MSVRIAIMDPLPVYRRGIMATLSDVGFEPETPDDLVAWSSQPQRSVVLLTLHEPEAWALLGRLGHTNPDLVVIAVLVDVRVQTYVRAILAGAAAALPRNAAPETLRRAFEEAVNGISLLPTQVVHALATGEDHIEGGPALAARDVQWLRELAEGATVAELAERAGYSERAMFRILRELYSEMGVKNRTEALIRAQQHGWL